MKENYFIKNDKVFRKQRISEKSKRMIYEKEMAVKRFLKPKGKSISDFWNYVMRD